MSHFENGWWRYGEVIFMILEWKCLFLREYSSGGVGMTQYWRDMEMSWRDCREAVFGI